jgi:hypothetical protein
VREREGRREGETEREGGTIERMPKRRRRELRKEKTVFGPLTTTFLKDESLPPLFLSLPPSFSFPLFLVQHFTFFL